MPKTIQEKSFSSVSVHIWRFVTLTIALSPFPRIIPYNFFLQQSIYTREDLLILGGIATAVLGLLGTVLWHFYERKVSSEKIYYLCEGIIRYFLAYIFVIYSFAKFYRTQLYEPPYSWLATSLGELTGFQLVWSFFGSSYIYSSFIGITQLTCALLLMFRRTQLLGACLLLPIISNIVFVNFAYDVPVKLFSSLYLVMTIYLVMSDFGRLKQFFWDNEAVPKKKMQPFINYSPLLRYGLKGVLILAIFSLGFITFETLPEDQFRVEQEIGGIWKVHSFSKNGQQPSSPDDSQNRWEQLVFNESFGGTQAMIKYNDGTDHGTYQVDTLTNEITFKTKQFIFNGDYELRDSDNLIVNGKVNGDSVWVRLVRK